MKETDCDQPDHKNGDCIDDTTKIRAPVASEGVLTGIINPEDTETRKIQPPTLFQCFGADRDKSR
jgi:hypothetical protein